MNTTISYKTANSIKAFEDGKNLFQQYATSLEIDLSFQDFISELAAIDKQYNMPEGALILAYNDDIAVGCAGIRKLDTQTAELKRMFVLPEFRKYKIGATLLQLAIDNAKHLGYNIIRLDTLPSMTQAQNLYRSFGFYEIPAYRYNPVEGTVFMEKRLY